MACTLSNKVIYRLLRIKPTEFCSFASYSSKQKTHYEVLGLTPNATFNDIKAAFYELSMQCHPDKDPRPDAKERFQQISQAYEVLGNHAARKQYDMKIQILKKPQTHSRKKTQVSADTSEHKYSTHGMNFDYDTWAEEHYQQIFQFTRSRRKKYADYMSLKRQSTRLKYPHLIVGSLILSVAIVWILHVNLTRDEDVPRITEENATEENVTEDNSKSL